MLFLLRRNVSAATWRDRREGRARDAVGANIVPLAILSPSSGRIRGHLPPGEGACQRLSDGQCLERNRE